MISVPFFYLLYCVSILPRFCSIRLFRSEFRSRLYTCALHSHSPISTPPPLLPCSLAQPAVQSLKQNGCLSCMSQSQRSDLCSSKNLADLEKVLYFWDSIQLWKVQVLYQWEGVYLSPISIGNFTFSSGSLLTYFGLKLHCSDIWTADWCNAS